MVLHKFKMIYQTISISRLHWSCLIFCFQQKSHDISKSYFITATKSTAKLCAYFMGTLYVSVIILCMGSANQRWYYNITVSHWLNPLPDQSLCFYPDMATPQVPILTWYNWHVTTGNRLLTVPISRLSKYLHQYWCSYEIKGQEWLFTSD